MPTFEPLGAQHIQVFDGDLPESVAAEFSLAATVAVDTETSGLSWELDRLRLCQLFSPSVGVTLVRPASRPPQRLIRLLEDRSVQKIFHFAPFDLRFLRANWGVRARNVRCTKTAHKLLEPTAPTREHSLAPLARKYLDVHLDKGAVRVSDWGVEDLSESQVLYAARDVLFLIPLLERLRSELSTLQRDELFDAVCEYLPIGVELEVGGFPDPFQY